METNGFAALISAIIISAALISVVASLSLGGFFARFNMLGTEFKSKSLALAEACVEIARLRIAVSPGYAGMETATLGSDTCFIRPIQSLGSEKIIEAQAIVDDRYSNVRAYADSNTLDITSWEEISHF